MWIIFSKINFSINKTTSMSNPIVSIKKSDAMFLKPKIVFNVKIMEVDSINATMHGRMPFKKA